MTTTDKIKFAGILVAATAAAIEAANAYDAKLPPETSRGLDCGFAWVDLPTATTPFARYCRAQAAGGDSRHYGSKHWRKGWQFWNPSNHNTQSIGTKLAGAQAFAEVLRANGIDAYAGSRLD